MKEKKRTGLRRKYRWIFSRGLAMTGSPATRTGLRCYIETCKMRDSNVLVKRWFFVQWDSLNPSEVFLNVETIYIKLYPEHLFSALLHLFKSLKTISRPPLQKSTEMCWVSKKQGWKRAVPLQRPCWERRVAVKSERWYCRGDAFTPVIGLSLYRGLVSHQAVCQSKAVLIHSRPTDCKPKNDTDTEKQQNTRAVSRQRTAQFLLKSRCFYKKPPKQWCYKFHLWDSSEKDDGHISIYICLLSCHTIYSTIHH